MRDKGMWLKIYGRDADLLAYCQRRGAVTPTLDILIDFLDQYEVAEDEEFKRRRLPKTAKLWLERLAAWRFGFKTYAEEFPTLSYWCERLDVSRKHLIRIWRFLARQGLLDVPEDHKQGRALRFGVKALLDKVRAWLRIGGDSAPAVEELQPEPWAMEQPKPAPVPEPEPEPEPLPIAASEWNQALSGIEREISPKDYLLYFAKTRAYWSAGRLTVKANNPEQWTMLQNRYRRVINRNVGQEVIILGPRSA